MLGISEMRDEERSYKQAILKSKLFLGILNSQYILERDRVAITKKLISEF